MNKNIMSHINFLLSLKSVPVISWVYINDDWYIKDFNQKAKEFFGTEYEIMKLLNKRKIRLGINNVWTGKVETKKISNVKGHTLKIIKDENTSTIFTLLEKAEADLNKLFSHFDNSSIGISLIKSTKKNNNHFNIKYSNKIMPTLIEDLDDELSKGLNSRIIGGNKKFNVHSCGDNNHYLVIVERTKNISREIPMELNVYKSIKLELNSIYAVLDLTSNSECGKDVRESCDEISQTIDDYYYSTLIDRDDVSLDLTAFNIHDLINSFNWTNIDINYDLIPWIKGDYKKIQYILNAFYTSNSSIELFLKKNMISHRSRIIRSSYLDLQNVHFRIKFIKEVNPKSIRYRIVEYLCNLMDGSLNHYGNEVVFNLILTSNRRESSIGLISNTFKDKNILVWSDNWNQINNILNSLGIHAVHGSTKKRVKSYIKTHTFDAIIIDKSVPKPKGVKTAIYLLNKTTLETKGHIVIDFDNFNVISCYNILKKCLLSANRNNNNNSSPEDSIDTSDIPIMKTYVLINDTKSKSLICKQIKTLNQNIVDNPKDADVILTEIQKGSMIKNIKDKILVGVNFGPQLTNRQKNRIYKSNVSLILNSPVTTNDLNLMYQALSSS